MSHVSEPSEDLLADATPVEDFLTWSQWALARVGFRPMNALALVAVCRDELMADFEAAVGASWGRPFDLGALAGMVLVGRTGLAAALSHVPGEDGRHRFVVFCIPHIGMDATGRVGRVQRRGRLRASSACGALVAVRADLQARHDRLDLDDDDLEQSALRRRLSSIVAAQQVPSLFALTDLVRRAAVADVRRFVDLSRADEPVDVAYVSGILVHGPDGADSVVAVHAEVVIDGVVIELPH